MSKVKAYYKYELTSLVASNTASGYSVDNLLIFLESSLWKGVGSSDHYISFDAGVGNTISADYFGVANHNLSGANVELQCSDTNYLQEEVFNRFLLGDFETVSGMTPFLATQAIVGGGESGNCLEITNSGAAAGYCTQLCGTITIGSYYKFTVYFKKGTGVSGSIKVGTSGDDDAYASWTGLTDASWTAYTTEFIATENQVLITFSNESTTTGETALFDTATLYIMDIDIAVNFTPSNNFPFLKEFTSLDKRYWRIKLSNLSSIPFMGISYWGDRVEWDYPALFDPSAESNKANVNVSPTGYLLAINNKFIERSISLKFKRADDGGTLWLALRSWWENHGLNLMFIAWDIENHPNEIYFVYPDPRFRGPFKTANRREVSLNFKGRVAR